MYIFLRFVSMHSLMFDTATVSGRINYICARLLGEITKTLEESLALTEGYLTLTKEWICLTE